MLVFDFFIYVNTLAELFSRVKPEVIPWLEEFIAKNPGYVRIVLGEPLFIWWFSRSLSLSGPDKEYWGSARGPLVVGGVEVDVVSILCRDRCRYAVAEVKISKNLKELENAIKQVVKAAAILKHAEYVKTVAPWCKSRNSTYCTCEEAAITTLYDIGNIKDVIREKLEIVMKENNLECEAEVYDINDVLTNLHGLRSDEKDKYRRLFLVMNKILETT